MADGQAVARLEIKHERDPAYDKNLWSWRWYWNGRRGRAFAQHRHAGWDAILENAKSIGLTIVIDDAHKGE
jgi:hypothetical protein